MKEIPVFVRDGSDQRVSCEPLAPASPPLVDGLTTDGQVDLPMCPAVDLRDDGASVLVHIDLPGVADEDVTVEIAGGMLVVRGRRLREGSVDESYYVAERDHGWFERNLPLPDGLDETQADMTLDRGVLRVVLPRRET